MFSFSRNSRSQIANWWWTVDKVLLTLITVLIIIGIFLNFSASPAVARRIGVDSFHFVKRQMVFIPLAIGIILYLSMQNLRFIRRTAIIGYIITMLLMVMALLWGEEIKGASRWIRIFGFSLQPSEFIKPTFAVVAAWLFDAQKKYQDIPGTLLSSILFALTFGLPACPAGHRHVFCCYGHLGLSAFLKRIVAHLGRVCHTCRHCRTDNGLLRFSALSHPRDAIHCLRQ